MIDMELETQRIELEKELEIGKAKLKSVLKEMALRNQDVDDMIEMIDQIKEGKTDYPLTYVVWRLQDDLSEIETLMRYKDSCERLISDTKYSMEHLEDDYIEV